MLQGVAEHLATIRLLIRCMFTTHVLSKPPEADLAVQAVDPE